MSENRRFAVYGNPIKHSRSPFIHSAFGKQCGIALEYRAVRIELADFSRATTAFFASGGAGLNITVPFKEEAFALVDESTPRARRARAVNTLWTDSAGRLRGENTDGVGLVRDMVANMGWQLRGKSVLVMGAGGAVRGFLDPLLLEQPARVHIVNRTVEKAERLCDEFSGGRYLSFSGYQDLPAEPFDLVVNGSSAGFSEDELQLDGVALSEKCCCYDMMYGPEPTPFMRWAAKNLAWAVSDGLGMLVEQAAEAFYVWHGVRPNSQPVIQQLRGVLAAAA